MYCISSLRWISHLHNSSCHSSLVLNPSHILFGLILFTKNPLVPSLIPKLSLLRMKIFITSRILRQLRILNHLEEFLIIFLSRSFLPIAFCQSFLGSNVGTLFSSSFRKTWRVSLSLYMPKRSTKGLSASSLRHLKPWINYSWTSLPQVFCDFSIFWLRS